MGVKKNIEWHEAFPNQNGVKTVAIDKSSGKRGLQIVGFNGFQKGSRVLYYGISYVVTFVSRRGSIGIGLEENEPTLFYVKPHELTEDTNPSDKIELRFI